MFDVTYMGSIINPGQAAILGVGSERRRFRVFGGRVSVPTPRKLGIALRCWVQSRWGQPMRGRTRA